MKKLCLQGFTLPEDFLVGTATASGQIEGGVTGTDWEYWCESGHIKDGTSITRANNHWEKWEEDFLLMKEMGLKIYRMSIEWSRIQPERGVFSAEPLKQYATMLTRLREYGIKPLVTLHHFTQPKWFFDMGGFSNPESPKIFEEYTEFVITHLGKYCDEWLTINEPSVHASMGFLFGVFPPGKTDMKTAMAVLRNQSIAHILAYKTIHRLLPGKEIKVGAAHHIRVFMPAAKFNPIAALIALFMDKASNKFPLMSSCYGKFTFPVGGKSPFGKGKYFEFIGLNYYSTFRCSTTGAEVVKKGLPINDLGWEIYPEGIIKIVRKLHKKYKAPIYITENGTCDNNDVFRSKYIAEHIYACKLAIDKGYDVKRYYHWTFMDNFEWCEGESARFGAVHNDFETQTRTVKASGKLLSRLSTERTLSQEEADALNKTQYNKKS